MFKAMQMCRIENKSGFVMFFDAYLDFIFSPWLMDRRVCVCSPVNNNGIRLLMYVVLVGVIVNVSGF